MSIFSKNASTLSLLTIWRPECPSRTYFFGINQLLKGACLLEWGQSELFSGVLKFWFGETRFHVSFNLKIESQILNRAKIYSIFLEKEMATHSSILAQRLLWTEGPGGLLSMGLLRVGCDSSDLAAAAVYSILGKKLVHRRYREN